MAGSHLTGSPEVLQNLTLLRGAPSFALQVGADKIRVSSPDVVPDRSGLWMLSGRATLNNERAVDAVFLIDTDQGGAIRDYWWLVGTTWHEMSARAALLAALDLDESEVFPFDWTTAIALENDIFHP